MTRKVAIDEEQVRAFLTEVFEDDLHVKRILSLAHATLGAVQATSLSVAAIGKAMVWARGEDVTSKHAVRQVDRLLSNGGFNVWNLFAAWVPFVLAESREAVIALDWTDFEKDDQESLVNSLITRHGRATPLVWTTLVKSASAGNRQLVEDQTLQRLREVIASHVVNGRGHGPHPGRPNGPRLLIAQDWPLAAGCLSPARGGKVKGAEPFRFRRSRPLTLPSTRAGRADRDSDPRR
ncbi:MAG: hypothetical protein EOO70_01660 [Myxococcaceae bacterium]|nr:MAG: hypothetical protein EOO70_01660 [Myxococcaceae bacterium]